MQMAKFLNGKTLAAWIAVTLLAIGMFAGAIVYAANGHFKSDAAMLRAETALAAIQEEKQARLAAEKETRAYRQDVNMKLGKMLGILEREGE